MSKLAKAVDEAAIDRLQARLEYRFSDVSLLYQAMIHRSFLNERGGAGLQSNERLEYLGDAILDVVVAKRLYRDFPEAGEGWMTVARSQLVRNDNLGVIGRELGLGRCLVLSAGRDLLHARDSVTVLSDTLEAIIGAISLDGGDQAAQHFIFSLLDDQFIALERGQLTDDSKSQLQRLTQSRFGEQPSYLIVDESGLPHEPWFEAAVEVGGDRIGSGEGRSKQAAEMDAAQQALASLGAQTPQ